MADNERIEIMNVRTKAPKKVGAVLPAPKNTLRNKPYRKPASLSSRKLLIGGLLLFGNKQQKVFFFFFEATLRQYEALRLVSKDASDKPGSKNSHRFE